MSRTFEQVHVVSDLHLGGRSGFQIFEQGDLLAQTFSHIANVAPPGRIALVLNGDTLDFLAEEPAEYLDSDQQRALVKYRRIRGDPHFSAVFGALRDFLTGPDHELVVVLGNHDLELALPAVREELISDLAGDDSARGRICLAFDGTGYRCQVGDKAVLCLHGNVDALNVVDHNALRKAVRALKRGQPPDPWTPNAGTKLVVDVMNDIKRNHPFVDLLKPEVKAVIPILVAIDPGVLRKVSGLVRVAARGLADWRRLPLLGEECPESTPGVEGLSLEGLLQETFTGSQGIHGAGPPGANALKLLEDRLPLDQDPLELVQSDPAADGLLGWGDLVGWLRGDKKGEALRRALASWLDKDRSFCLQERDTLCSWVDDNVGSDIDFIIAGHTHLARAIALHQGKAAYYNSGTWANLIQMDKAKTAPDVFPAVYRDLQSTTMAGLDAAGLICRSPRVVSICRHGLTAIGELRQASVGASGYGLNGIAGTEIEVV